MCVLYMCSIRVWYIYKCELGYECSNEHPGAWGDYQETMLCALLPLDKVFHKIWVEAVSHQASAILLSPIQHTVLGLQTHMTMPDYFY